MGFPRLGRVIERVLTTKDHSSNCLGEHLLSDSGRTMRESQRPYNLPSFARQPSFIDARYLHNRLTSKAYHPNKVHGLLPLLLLSLCLHIQNTNIMTSIMCVSKAFNTLIDAPIKAPCGIRDGEDDKRFCAVCRPCHPQLAALVRNFYALTLCTTLTPHRCLHAISTRLPEWPSQSRAPRATSTTSSVSVSVAYNPSLNRCRDWFPPVTSQRLSISASTLSTLEK